MHSTPASLLARLGQPGEQLAWQRFVRLYTPLLFHWTKRLGLQEHDGADLVQDVFALLVRKLPEFAYDPSRRFRGWLWTLTLNKARERQRRAEPLHFNDGAFAEERTVAPEVDGFIEAEYRAYVVQRALRLMQTEFQDNTWKACWELVVNSRSGEDVARELGLSVGAVYVAKSRVLRRLRQELDGLME